MQFLQVRERNCCRSSFWILCNGGITDQRKKLNIKPVSKGVSKDGCNASRNSAIEHFGMESGAYKICERWAT